MSTNNPFEEAFGPLPAETEATRPLNADQWALVEWDTTPLDLREDGEKSLPGFLKANSSLTVPAAMKLMQMENYKIKRRSLSIEKGEFDHKTRVIMDGLYAEAVKGKAQAAKEWRNFYGLTVDDLPQMGVTEADPEPPEPPSIKNLTNEELEVMLAAE